MNHYRQFRVKTDEGIDAIMFATSRFLDENDQRLLRFPDGQEFLVARNLLQSEVDGSYRLTVPLKTLQHAASAGRADFPAQNDASQANMVVPALEEHLEIEKRLVETGRVRIQKTVESSDAIVDEPLLRQRYEIERVPINRLVAEEVEARYEGEVLILPVLEEVLVVEKRLMLREELRITRTQQEVRDPQKHTVRREHIEVERIGST